MKRLILIPLVCLLALSACGQEPTSSDVIAVPTAAVPASVPTLPPPVVESTSPASDASDQPAAEEVEVEIVVEEAEVAPAPEAEAESAEEVVEEPEVEVVEPEPTVDESILPEVNIVNLGDKSGQAGELLVLAGRAARRTNQSLVARLISLDGRELLSQEIEELDFGAWETTITLPSTFSGQARFAVDVLNEDGSSAAGDSILVNITPDTGQDRYLILDQPGPEGTGTSDYYLFFDGFANKPVDFKISIAVLTDNCRTQVSRQSFPMNGSGSWRGFVQIPQDVTGEACAIAWFGEAGSADRREAQYLINVVPKDEGTGTTIGWPKAGDTIKSGQTVFFQGVTVNPTDETLSIQIRLADGSVAAGDIVTVQSFGYWEAELLIPVDVTGEVQVVADGGNGSDTILLEVE